MAIYRVPVAQRAPTAFGSGVVGMLAAPITTSSELGLSILVAATTTAADVIHRQELGLSILIVATTATTTETAHDKELALTVPVVAATTATDLLHDRETALSFPIAATTVAIDLLHDKELGLSVPVTASTTATDFLHLKELTLSVLVAATTVTSAETARDKELALTVPVAATTTGTDFLHRKELALSVPVAATTTGTDLLHYKELTLSIPVAATTVATDLLHLKELGLSLPVAATTVATDLLHRKELTLSVLVVAATTTTDTAHRKELAGSLLIAATTTGTDTPTAGTGDWQTAVDSGSLATMQAWYAANTGYLSQGVLESSMWGSASADLTITSAWLTANAAAGKVVNDGGGHWTVTGLQCRYLTVQVSHLTLRHCHVDMGGNWSGYGVFVIDPVTGLEDDCSNVDLRAEYCTFESGGVFWITNKQLTSNVATLTYTKSSLSTPLLTVGKTLEIRLDPPDTTFDANVEAGQSRVTITAVTPTTFSYARTHANVASTACGGFATTAIEGNYGDVMYYVPSEAAAVADGFVFDHCIGKDWRAAFMFNMGATAQYCWVPSLTFYGAEPHNTSSSIRGRDCKLYRNLFETGTSSAVSLYADYYPYSGWDVTENIMHAPTDYEVNFPTRGTGWSPLENGFRRELVGNYFERGFVDDTRYFTKTFDNKLFDGTPAPFLMDEGASPVPTEPVLLKVCWNNFGGGDQPFLDTWEFTPSPNSTLLLFAAVIQGGHTTAPAPTVTVTGQYPQTFSSVTSSASEANVGGDTAHALRLFLYKAQTGSVTSFEHIRFDPYSAAQTGYICFWVYEVTGVTGMTLAHSIATMKHSTVAIDNITTGALSGSAANGNLSMAFAACDDFANGAPAAVAGWLRSGVQNINQSPGNHAVTGATYWRKDFTGTTFTIADLGTDVGVAGVLLTEFTLPSTGSYDETDLPLLIAATVTATSQADFEDHPVNLAIVATTATFIEKATLHDPGLTVPIVATTTLGTQKLGLHEALTVPVAATTATITEKVALHELGLTIPVVAATTGTDSSSRVPENLSIPVVATVTAPVEQADFHNTALALAVTATTTTGTEKVKIVEPGLVPITATTTLAVDKVRYRELASSVPITAFVTGVSLQQSPGHYDETQRSVVVVATTTLAVDQADYDELALTVAVTAATMATDSSRRRELALAISATATTTGTDTKGLHYVEALSVTAVVTTNGTDLGQFRDARSLSAVVAVSGTDLRHISEVCTLAVVVATVTVADSVTNTENMPVSVGSTVTSTDLINYGEVALFVPVVATVSVAHALAVAMRLTFLIQAVIRATDFKSRVGITILNDAEAVFLGDEQVSRIYVGASQAWP